MITLRDLAGTLVGLGVVLCLLDSGFHAHPESPAETTAAEEGWALSPERLRAVRLFRGADYAQAAIAFETWLEEHPGDHDARVLLGWSRFRQGAFAAAGEAFREALDGVPDSTDARVGTAYVALQTRPVAEAAAAFDAVLALEPSNRDALRGRALTATRPGADANVAEGSADASRALLTENPGDDEAAWTWVTARRLLGEPGEIRRQTATARLGPPEHRARVGKDLLEVLGPDGRWSPVFVKGINLGAALPGRFPTEFPRDEAIWRQWLDVVAGIGANAVRTYTLLPPAFYRMLAERNAYSGEAGKIWLLQGVWTELPPRHDFSDPAYEKGFREEIARVVDAVHGDLVLAERPGHASGVYDADASRFVLAWIVGREWEPFAVVDYDASRPGPCDFRGDRVETSSGRAMECWIARVLDFTAGYEAGRYGEGRPLTFANWPTLDPLSHPTESNRSDEEAARRRLGLPAVDVFRGEVWDNDAISIDATKIRATEDFPPGVFASYHVYPNYPDFLNNDPRYAPSPDAPEASRYGAYLRELKSYHGEQPVLIAEFGMSTSRGVAHVQPEGWHHGGHDEREAMEVSARLLRTIHEERMAGGVHFAFQDEWFKGTWSVAPLESPPDRRRLWFNAESPEQSYGIVANRPEAPVVVDGRPWDWSPSAVVATGSAGDGWRSLRSLSAVSDEGYLYLLLRTDGGGQPPDWGRLGFRIGIDTYDPLRGERSLPETPGGEAFSTGVEFVVSLSGPEASEVRVVSGYDPAAARDGAPVFSPERPGAGFVPLRLETNRERIARDGTRIPAIVWSRGALRFGSLDPSSEAFDTRTDVSISVATGSIEVRIPWGLLNVADPSSHRILHQETSHDGTPGTIETGGFRFAALAVDPSRDFRVISRLPPDGEPQTWRWPGWEEPRFRSELKHGVDALRGTFRALSANPAQGTER